MSFRGKKTVLLFVFSFLLTSCSWWGGEKDNNSNIRLSDNRIEGFGDISCIKNTGEFFGDYFAGRSSTAEIMEMKTCIEETLDTMFELAYKDDEIGFNRVRVKNILSSVVENSYDLDEMTELMFRLKRFFVGGGKDSFFIEEWFRFKSELPYLAKALDTSRYAASLLFYSTKEKKLLEREVLYDTLKSSFQEFDFIKNKFPKTLKKEEALALILSILKVSSLEVLTDLIKAGFDIIYPGETIFFEEQQSFVKTVWDVLIFQSRIREVSFPNGLLYGETTADLIKSVGMISSRLSRWGNLYPNEYSFLIDDVKKLISELFNSGFLDAHISNDEALNKTFENFALRIFGSPKLENEDFDLVYDAYKTWADLYPKLIVDLDDEWAKTVLISLSTNLDYSEVLATDKDLFDEKYIKSFPNDESINSRYQNFEVLLESFDKPHFISEPNRPVYILFDENRTLSPIEQYFDKSLKQLFLVVVDPIARAYNPELNRYNSPGNVVMDKLGLGKLISDFRPIGLELGLVNSYNCNFEERIFLESNLLTRNANGDEFVSVFEAAEWLGTMIVTSNLTNHVFSRIGKECAYEGIEVNGYPFYKRSCFKKSLFNNSETLENFFPSFKDYLRLLGSDSRKSEFEEKITNSSNIINNLGIKLNKLDIDYYQTTFTNKMNACLQNLNDDIFLEFPLSRAEFNGTIAALIYIENFFLQYDKTGLKGGFFGGGDDPVGSDLIIDGGEVSSFIKERVSEENKQLILGKIKEIVPSSVYKIIKGQLEKLGDGIIRLDRQYAISFMTQVLSDNLVLNPLEQEYCYDVVKSAEQGSIFYDVETQATCPVVK